MFHVIMCLPGLTHISYLVCSKAVTLNDVLIFLGAKHIR